MGGADQDLAGRERRRKGGRPERAGTRRLCGAGISPREAGKFSDWSRAHFDRDQRRRRRFSGALIGRGKSRRRFSRIRIGSSIRFSERTDTFLVSPRSYYHLLRRYEPDFPSELHVKSHVHLEPFFCASPRSIQPASQSIHPSIRRCLVRKPTRNKAD